MRLVRGDEAADDHVSLRPVRTRGVARVTFMNLPTEMRRATSTWSTPGWESPPGSSASAAPTAAGPPGLRASRQTTMTSPPTPADDRRSSHERVLPAPPGGDSVNTLSPMTASRWAACCHAGRQDRAGLRHQGVAHVLFGIPSKRGRGVTTMPGVEQRFGQALRPGHPRSPTASVLRWYIDVIVLHLCDSPGPTPILRRTGEVRTSAHRPHVIQHFQQKRTIGSI